MTKYLFLAVLAMAAPARAAYFDTILSDPAHPHASAGALLDSRFVARGGVVNYALVWHKANADDSLIPKSWQAKGVKPIGWSLVDVGLGKERGEFVASLGSSLNLAPSVIGTFADKLKESSSLSLKALGNFLYASEGTGVAFGPKWYAHPVEGSTFKPFNQWDFRPGWFVGGMWQF